MQLQQQQHLHGPGAPNPGDLDASGAGELPYRLAFGVLTFMIGWIVGTIVVVGDSCTSAWNPVIYWQMATALGQSPWSWGDGDLRESLVENRRELLGAGFLAVGTGAAYLAGGPVLAWKALAATAQIAGGRAGATAMRVCGAEDSAEDRTPARSRRQRRARALQSSEHQHSSGSANPSTALVPTTAGNQPLIVD